MIDLIIGFIEVGIGVILIEFNYMFNLGISLLMVGSFYIGKRILSRKGKIVMNEEERKAVEELKRFTNSYTDMKAISMAELKIIYNLVETQNKSIEILVAQKEEYKKDSDKWFRKLQEEHTKYIKINDRKDKTIDKLIECLAEERGTDEDEIREVFGCE